MKILIDGVYTGRVHKCSTSYVMWEIITGLIDWRDDIFFYLLAPPLDKTNPEETAFLSRHQDRVTVLPYKYLQTDRVEEAFKINDELLHLISPGDTPVWDYDVVLTSRIPQIPMMRNASGREANFDKGTHRLFVGIECMPFFSFRDTVPWTSGGRMDLHSLASYEAAGAILIADLWSKAEILKIAKQWLTPSRAVNIGKNISEVLPTKLQRLQVGKYQKAADTLNVMFAGRMTGTRNFKEVADLFRKHASFPLDKARKVNFTVSTNSMSVGTVETGELDFIDIQFNNRDAFYKALREQAHLVVNLSTVEDFSLSTYEPLWMGVPTIVPRHEWTNFLGADYPFRAGNFTEAYALVKDFANDYAGQYAKFVKWEATTWKALVEGPRNVSTIEGVKTLLEAHEKKLHATLGGGSAGGVYKEILRRADTIPDKRMEMLQFAYKQNYFLTNAKQWHGIPIGLRPCEYLLKVYANLAGWRDTNDAGIMERD